LKKWVVCTDCGACLKDWWGISAHRFFRQAPQFWTGQILQLLLYLIFIIWTNGLYAPIVMPASQTNGCNNGISAPPSFRQALQFWTGQILLLLLYLNFITWRNGLHAPQFWTGWILCLLFIWWWVQNIISYWHTVRRLMGAVDGCHNPAKVGQSIPNGTLFVAAHPCRMAKFRVSAQSLPMLPMANSWKLCPFHWPAVDGRLSHSTGPSVTDPFDCPNCQHFLLLSSVKTGHVVLCSVMYLIFIWISLCLSFYPW